MKFAVKQEFFQRDLHVHLYVEDPLWLGRIVEDTPQYAKTSIGQALFFLISICRSIEVVQVVDDDNELSIVVRVFYLSGKGMKECNARIDPELLLRHFQLRTSPP